MSSRPRRAPRISRACWARRTRAVALEREAEALRQRFEDRFWLDELDCYALALDGRKQPCRVLSSNAGHALFAGIADPERAARLARLLTGKRFFSGWGVRTIAAGEARYNPMSYHNGSVWPHDNALIALGLGALRPQGGGAEAVQGPDRRRHLRRVPAPARAVLRLLPPPQARADRLSGRLLAPGLGGGGALRPGRRRDRPLARP